MFWCLRRPEENTGAPGAGAAGSWEPSSSVDAGNQTQSRIKDSKYLDRAGLNPFCHPSLFDWRLALTDEDFLWLFHSCACHCFALHLCPPSLPSLCLADISVVTHFHSLVIVRTSSSQPLGVAYHIPCISNIYVMIENSSKIAVME